MKLRWRKNFKGNLQALINDRYYIVIYGNIFTIRDYDNNQKAILETESQNGAFQYIMDNLK